jgi:hypothetical protein
MWLCREKTFRSADKFGMTKRLMIYDMERKIIFLSPVN